MQIEAPKFLDRTGYMPFINLNYTFQQLREGFSKSRRRLGEERYQQLSQMSDQMRALFAADPDDKTGETTKGREMIYEMERILRSVPRKS
ncbi:MAG: hypothetical protein E7774_02785 [Bradyrhizobium sp.]|nr:MAG: hypothetical protein E7774_02785 [Bradyrhizobium sp.]